MARKAPRASKSSGQGAEASTTASKTKKDPVIKLVPQKKTRKSGTSEEKPKKSSVKKSKPTSSKSDLGAAANPVVLPESKVQPKRKCGRPKLTKSATPKATVSHEPEETTMTKKRKASPLPGRKSLQKRKRHTTESPAAGVVVPVHNHNKEHPLLNSLVMSNILGYIEPGVNELKQLRLVCKLWYEVTLSTWRKCAVLKLVPDVPMFSCKPGNGIAVSEFFSEFEDPESSFQFAGQPFMSYNFSGVTFDITAFDNEPKSKRFWEMVGPSIKYAHVSNGFFVDNVNSAFLVHFVHKMPNLQELVLTNVSRKLSNCINLATGSPSIRHQNLKTLTIHAPINLVRAMHHLYKSARKLELIQVFDQATCPVNVNFINSMAFSTNVFNNLKHLDLINSSALHHCEDFDNKVWDLVDNKFTLETLTARLCPKVKRITTAEDEGNIDIFLFSQQETLKTLKLFRPPLFKPFTLFLQDGHMTALTEIRLWGNIVKNLHFLWRTPNLKVLYINLACYDRWDEMKHLVRHIKITPGVKRSYQPYGQDLVKSSDANFLRGLVLLQLKALHIDYMFPAKSLQQLGQWMPNVERLETIVNGGAVPVIYEQWKGLTELNCLYGSTLNNASIIRTGKTDKGAIADLKCLQRFRLDGDCSGSKLGDKAVTKGFLNMQSLKYIQLSVGENMSAEAEESLKGKIKNCRIIRGHAVTPEGQPPNNYECCKREQFKKHASNMFYNLR